MSSVVQRTPMPRSSSAPPAMRVHRSAFAVLSHRAAATFAPRHAGVPAAAPGVSVAPRDRDIVRPITRRALTFDTGAGAAVSQTAVAPPGVAAPASASPARAALVPPPDDAGALVVRSRSADVRAHADELARGYEGMATWWDAPGGRPDLLAGTIGPHTRVSGDTSLTVSHARDDLAVRPGGGGSIDWRGVYGYAEMAPGAAAAPTAAPTAGLSGYGTNGYVNAGGHVSYQFPDQLGWAVNASAYVAGYKDFLGAGISIAFATGLGTASCGLYGYASAKRKIVQLGPYMGNEPFLRDHLAGKEQIELQLHCEKGGRVVGGVGYGVGPFMIGVGGRLDLVDGKDIVYRTYVQPKRARELRAEDDDPRQFLRHKGEALGLIEGSVRLPDLTQLESLMPGDEYVLETRGKLRGGVVLGIAGVLTGGPCAEQETEVRLAVRKLDAHRVRVALCPTQLGSIGIIGRVHGLAAAGCSRVFSIALNQEFEFDLSKPEARDSYLAILDGELPAQSFDQSSAVGEHDSKRVLAMWQTERLPEGVTRTLLEKADVKLRSRAVGAGILFVPDELDGGKTKLSYRDMTANEHTVLCNGKVALATTSIITRSDQSLLSGDESELVSATIRKLTIPGAQLGRNEEIFDRLILRARFSDEQVRGLEHNRKMVQRMISRLGVRVRPFRVKGEGESREIVVERILQLPDLLALRDLKLSEVTQAAQKTGADFEDLRQMLTLLTSESDPEFIARVIKQYIEHHKLAGMGAVLQLLRPGDRAQRRPVAETVTVRTMSNLYTQPVLDARDFALDFPAPLDPQDVTRAEINARFTRSRELVARITRALATLDDDPVMRKFDQLGYEVNKKALLTALEQARGIVDLSHIDRLERQKIYNRIDKRDLVQDFEFIKLEYAPRIHRNATRADLKDRWKAVRAYMDRVDARMRSLYEARMRSETLEQRLDPEYEALSRIYREAEQMLSFGHLTRLERSEVLRRVAVRSGWGPFKRKLGATANQILGALRDAGVGEVYHVQPAVEPPAFDVHIALRATEDTPNAARGRVTGVRQ